MLGATAVWAADGDSYKIMECMGDYCERSYLLCDDFTDDPNTDPETCTDFDLTTRERGGWPHHYQICIDDPDSNCSSTVDVTPQAKFTAAGTAFDLVTTALTPASTACTVIEFATHPLVNVSITDSAGCDDFDVIITLFFER
jgi:hypothetical protein